MIFTSKKIISSKVPGQNSIDLEAYYEEFSWYYPDCELNTKQWFISNAKKDWVYIDAGANVGIYTILFSRLSPDGFIYAFEPTDTLKYLRENIKFNKVKNSELFNYALGKKTGKQKDKIFRIWGKEPESATYQFITIDDFVTEKNLSKLDAIKIDVDSYDFEVLQGAQKTLKKFNPWLIVELNHALSKRGQSNSEAFLWLHSQGYNEALVIDHENFVLKKGEENNGSCFKLFY